MKTTFNWSHGFVPPLLLLLTMSALVQAQFTFATNNGSITITEYTGSNGVVVIPNWTNGFPVTSIGNNAFSGCNRLTNVTISYGVQSIGNYAFGGCVRLTCVQIPDSVTSIGSGAFESCASLTNVTIPVSLSHFGLSVFQYCANLTAITVAAQSPYFSSLNGVLYDRSQTTIVAYPSGLGASYVIPDGVTTIWWCAFEGCASLTNITIPTSVTSIDGGAFESCVSLTTIAIPNSVTDIPFEAFSGCSGLTDVTIPYGVSSIGEDAFAATGLTGIRVPGSVTNIGDFAFGDCSSLTNIWFAGNAPEVAASAFGFAEDLTVYYLPGTTGWSDFFASTGLSGALWLPQVNTGDGSFGLRNNQFGFSFNWASGMVVVVEACTNLSNPQWQPVQTNTLTGDQAYFTESLGTNCPGRYYRLRSL